METTGSTFRLCGSMGQTESVPERRKKYWKVLQIATKDGSGDGSDCQVVGLLGF